MSRAFVDADLLFACLDGVVSLTHHVGRVELGGQVYDQWCDVSGLPAAGLAVYQLPGKNALDVAKGIRETMKRLSERFPPGLEYSVPFNTTIFVEESISEVYKTLIEAGILVLIVILVFL
ncbi:MAG: efflux RND transporter permease subunit, partial [Pandoraea sp.]|nr:efflux RND transporter permease subunit [Pandoraea sp.]